MSASEMLEFYMQKVLESRAENGLLSDYSENLLGYAAQLAQVVQAQAAVRQAVALERLALAAAQGEPLTDGTPRNYLRVYRIAE